MIFGMLVANKKLLYLVASRLYIRLGRYDLCQM